VSLSEEVSDTPYQVLFGLESDFVEKNTNSIKTYYFSRIGPILKN